MLAKPECIPCCLRQVITTASRVTASEEEHARLLRQTMARLSNPQQGDPLARTPAELSTDLFRLVADDLGVPDPYGPEKERYNQEAIALFPRLRRKIAESADPLRTAVLLAVAGNLIDLGILAPMAVEEVVRGVLSRGLAHDDLPALRHDLTGARTLLYIGDNAGEIGFDRLLIEEIRREYPGLAVTFAVKSGPAMNDATREDAEAVGLGEVATILETGGAFLGAPRRDTSPAFREAFVRAGLVLAKGHANFETLDEEERSALFFLVTVKCEPVAGMIGVEVGESVLQRHESSTP